jgi:hypothetical protein
LGAACPAAQLTARALPCLLCAAYFAGAYGSGSDFDWQQAGGTDWLMSDFFDGGGGGDALAPGGGAAAGGAAPGSDFFELRSADWADSLASEVGAGRLAGWREGMRRAGQCSRRP